MSLFGEARVYKRSQAICAALLDLYNRQQLRVSFEIAYDTLLVVDGIEYIDASPNNVITGMAIVSRPAYPEAIATRLVAEGTAKDVATATPQEGARAKQDETERVNDMTMEEAKARIAELETQVQDLTQLNKQ